MTRIIGIDLGTTYTVAAIVDENGQPLIIRTTEGSRLLPSMVAQVDENDWLVGELARRQAVANPRRTISSIKRLIGRRYSELETERAMFPYEIVEGKGGLALVKIGDQVYSPIQLTALILGRVKRMAEGYLGQKVDEAIITVPAYFNDSQRAATKSAGKIAGLDVRRVFTEPTAAALFYGYGRTSSQDQTILVWDLGGGTFDVSLVNLTKGVLETRATAGDTHLGGDDWDALIVDWLIQGFQHTHGINLRADLQALARIREIAEKAKKDLSDQESVEINLPFIAGGAEGPKHIDVTLTRAQFEEMTTGLVERMKGPFAQILADAKVTVEELDDILLVGGSTRMPMVKALIRELTGKEPRRAVNPDEVVALGAAIQAGITAHEVQSLVLIDVTPLTLGIAVGPGLLEPVIRRNTAIPVEGKKVVTTQKDGQTAVVVDVYQGERPVARDNHWLGRLTLAPIPAAARGVPKIEVGFTLDLNGILTVSVVEETTGLSREISLTGSTQLDQAEVDRLVREAQAHEAEDTRRAELLAAQADAEEALIKASRQMADLRPEDEEARAALTAKIEALQAAAQSADAADIRRKVAAFATQPKEEPQPAANAAG